MIVTFGILCLVERKAISLHQKIKIITIKKVTIMKKIILALVAMVATSTISFGQSFNDNSRRTTTSSYDFGVNTNTTRVSGYTRSNGTYVNGYTRTQRNSTNHDNYSTSGNYNPYMGNTGSRARDYSTQSYNYGSGQTIKTGSRGGQYYVNSRGNKVYVPKRY